MDEYLERVVNNTAESMRDTLIDARIRFTPRRNWVVGQAIEIAFRDEASRDDARAALTDFQDFELSVRDVDDSPGLRFTHQRKDPRT